MAGLKKVGPARKPGKRTERGAKGARTRGEDVLSYHVRSRRGDRTGRWEGLGDDDIL